MIQPASVSDGPLAINSDLASDEELIAMAGPLVTQAQQQGATFTSTVPAKIAVDGARAFRLRGTFDKATHTIVMVFRGSHPDLKGRRARTRERSVTAASGVGRAGRYACSGLVPSIALVKRSV